MGLQILLRIKAITVVEFIKLKNWENFSVTPDGPGQQLLVSCTEYIALDFKKLVYQASKATLF